MNRVRHPIAAVAIALLLPGSVVAQTPAQQGSTVDRARDIATQPVRDVGLQRGEIPYILRRAAADPYSLDGVGTCARLSAAVIELDAVLGADFDAPSEPEGSQTGRVAEAGGRTIVNSVVPFRGLVRELSGAASADRQLQAAVNAGIARRGFLRGLERGRSCPQRPVR